VGLIAGTTRRRPRRAGEISQELLKIRERLCQAFSRLTLGPHPIFPCYGDVRLPALRVIFGRVKGNGALTAVTLMIASASCRMVTSSGSDMIGRSGQTSASVKSFHEITHITQAAGLISFSIHGQGLAQQGLNHEIGRAPHLPAHALAVGVKDSNDAHLIRVRGDRPW